MYCVCVCVCVCMCVCVCVCVCFTFVCVCVCVCVCTVCRTLILMMKKSLLLYLEKRRTLKQRIRSVTHPPTHALETVYINTYMYVTLK